VHPQVGDGGDDLQTWRLSAIILNKQTPNMMWSSILVVENVWKGRLELLAINVTKYYTALWTWTGSIIVRSGSIVNRVMVLRLP
jgi:hypothetical protein